MPDVLPHPYTLCGSPCRPSRRMPWVDHGDPSRVVGFPLLHPPPERVGEIDPRTAARTTAAPAPIPALPAPSAPASHANGARAAQASAPAAALLLTLSCWLGPWGGLPQLLKQHHGAVRLVFELTLLCLVLLLGPPPRGLSLHFHPALLLLPHLLLAPRALFHIGGFTQSPLLL